MSLPDAIGGLRVDALLGEGGMGRVYQCTDAGLGRQVAVKTLQPHLLDDAVMRERFVREARALARVKSSHVVTVHAIGEDPALGPYVVMERLVGEDLLSRLRHGPLDLDDLVAVARGVALGLKDAHDAGLLHRDIKPANLFLRGGRCVDVVVTDFGLAKDWGESPSAPGATDAVPASQLTSADVVVGTPAYLAPECARGRPASPASDLYALGATLFHLWTGAPPFAGDAPIDVLTKAVLQPAPRASSVRPGTPPALDALLLGLLEKTPEQRPASAAAVLERLAAVSTSTVGAAAVTDIGLSGTFATASMPSPSAPATSTPGGTGTLVLGTLGPEVTAPPTRPTTAAPAPAAPTFAAPPTTGSEGDPLVSSPKASAVRTATYTVMMSARAGRAATRPPAGSPCTTACCSPSSAHSRARSSRPSATPSSSCSRRPPTPSTAAWPSRTGSSCTTAAPRRATTSACGWRCRRARCGCAACSASAATSSASP
jgi:serine/threonine protein kinase